MKLVVTGAAGFVGEALRAECRRRAIETVGIDLVGGDDGVVQADVRDLAVADLLPEIADAVIHLAAISTDAACRTDLRLALEVNVVASLNLFECAKRRQVKQFIFASTEWVYGDVGHRDEVQREDQPIDATALKSEYALSKLLAEQYLRLASAGGGSLATAILRFGIVYGRRRGPGGSAVETLFNAVRTEESVTVESLATARRFIHVSDIATGIIAAVGRPGFDVFNVSGDTLISLGDIIAQSCELLERRPRVVERNPQVVSIRNPDNTKAKQVLGWEPRLDLKRGLATLL